MSIILSITTDRKPGGIATALHSYSQALSMRGHQHYVLLPSGSSAITSLLQLEGVTVVSMPAPLIRLHLLTRGLFSRKLRSAARAADMLLVHNARLTSPARSLGKPVALISHSGKMRHINAADHLVVLTSSAAEPRPRRPCSVGDTLCHRSLYSRHSAWVCDSRCKITHNADKDGLAGDGGRPLCRKEGI